MTQFLSLGLHLTGDQREVHDVHTVCRVCMCMYVYVRVCTCMYTIYTIYMCIVTHVYNIIHFVCEEKTLRRRQSVALGGRGWWGGAGARDLNLGWTFLPELLLEQQAFATSGAPRARWVEQGVVPVLESVTYGPVPTDTPPGNSPAKVGFRTRRALRARLDASPAPLASHELRPLAPPLLVPVVVEEPPAVAPEPSCELGRRQLLQQAERVARRIRSPQGVGYGRVCVLALEAQEPLHGVQVLQRVLPGLGEVGQSGFLAPCASRGGALTSGMNISTRVCSSGYSLLLSAKCSSGNGRHLLKKSLITARQFPPPSRSRAPGSGPGALTNATGGSKTPSSAPSRRPRSAPSCTARACDRPPPAPLSSGTTTLRPSTP